MAGIVVDIFLETLNNFITSSNLKLIIGEKDMFQLQSLQEELTDLRGFLEKTEKKPNNHSEVTNLVKQIRGVVSEAENIVELFVSHIFKANHASNSCLGHDQEDISLDLESVKEEIKTLRAEVKQILDQNMYDINGAAPKKLRHSSIGTGGDSGTLEGSNPSKVAGEKVVVGFKEEVDKLLLKLHDRGDDGPLEIVSIVGAGGGGKTTLAREVYDHPLTLEKFEVRSWVLISQDYDKTMKRDLLTRILKSVFPKNHEDYEKSNEDELGEMLLKCLKGKKYLIVMDDIWDIEAWNDIQRSFPNESKGSKVLFTNRQTIQSNSIILHSLDPLPKSSSWELLEKKVFGGKQKCPRELEAVGMEILEKCKGLPLAIVAVAGILATQDKKLGVWSGVAKNLSSIIAKDQETGCLEILELSYNYLPLHLKACFLYIGSHPEDYEISVRELIWLWVAEGFIQKNEKGESLEAIAKDYLIDLIDRNLVMVARKGKTGTIRSCHIHDLLRELCLKKAEEDKFIVSMFNNDSVLPSAAIKHRHLFIGRKFLKELSSYHEFSAKPHARICSFLCRLFNCHQVLDEFSSKSHAQNLRSFLCLPSSDMDRYTYDEQNLSFFIENFKLLRVLDFFDSLSVGVRGIEELVHLRYVALMLNEKDLKFFLSFQLHHLSNLETLILQDSQGLNYISLPPDILKMVNLRHLCFVNFMVFLDVDTAYGEEENMLDSLETLETVYSEDIRLLSRSPNLKKLTAYGPMRLVAGICMHPNLEFLKCLETFKFHGGIGGTSVRSIGLKLPSTLKRLTLTSTHLEWEQLSVISLSLPRLEVLKLRENACRGKAWNTSELGEVFSRLKYLELRSLDIVEWNASEDQFAVLEILVIQHCKELKEIPIEFADLNELCEIKVEYSTRSGEESARKIQEERIYSKGDDGRLNLLLGHNTVWTGPGACPTDRWASPTNPYARATSLDQGSPEKKLLGRKTKNYLWY